MIQEHAESAVATVGRHVQGRIVVADAEALRASVAVGAVDRWFSECGGLGVWEMDGDVEGFARELHTALQPLCMTGEMRGGAKLTFLMHDTGMVAVRTTRQLLAALERISHTALPTPHYVAVGPTPLSDIPSEHIPLTYVPMVDGTCYHLNLPDVMPFADSEVSLLNAFQSKPNHHPLTARPRQRPLSHPSIVQRRCIPPRKPLLAQSRTGSHNCVVYR